MAFGLSTCFIAKSLQIKLSDRGQSGEDEEGKIMREKQQTKDETRSDQVTGVLTLQRMRPEDSQAELLILSAAQGLIEC